MTDDVRPVQPIQASENYWSSDDQLYPTVGPDDSDIEAVEAASTETVRRVLKAVKSPSKVVDREADNPSSIPVRPDGSTGELPMMEIPGFGEEYSDCGKPMPMACSGCGHTATVGRTCRRSTCPRCGAAWVRDRAVNIAARLGATRAVRDSNRDEHQRYHHLAWMPPEDWRLEADDVLERTLHTIRDMMDALDIEGYVFYHPWSGSGHDDEQGDDRGKWKDRLFNGRDWRGDVREELNFRPHFHIVAVGHKVPGQDFTKTIYDKTGWILKRITKSEDSAVSIYNDEDLAKTVTYCLSHSAIDVNGGSDGSAQKTYRRYGRLVNSSEIEIDDAARDHHDQLVRRAATTTLGIPLKDQFCFAETVGNTGQERYDAMRSIMAANAADAAAPTPSGSGSGDDLPDAPSPIGQEASDDQEATECEGRMLHLCDARRLVDDDEWLEQAEHSDELIETIDEWSDRMGELIRWGPFNSG